MCCVKRRISGELVGCRDNLILDDQLADFLFSGFLVPQPKGFSRRQRAANILKRIGCADFLR